MPVSLARGTIETNFDLNIHSFYSIDISYPQGGNLICSSGVGLETRRISSLGGLPVYRYRWEEDESRARGRDTIAGSFLGGFEGKRGHYHLRIEVVSDTGCLDAGKPRLHVMASSNDFARWNNRYENALWISFVSGSLGLVLLIIGIKERLRRGSTDNPILEFLEPPRSCRNYPALRRVNAAPWIPFFSQFGILYAYILLLIILPAVLVFGYAWGFGHRSYGLFALTYFPESRMTSRLKQDPCQLKWVVRVESNEIWFLNSDRIAPADLPFKLRERVGERTGCLVLFDANPDVPFDAAICAIDMIEQTSAKVVLLTPQTKKVAIP